MDLNANIMTLGQITEVLEGMEMGSILAFANGALAERTEDGWEITLPEVNYGPQEKAR